MQVQVEDGLAGFGSNVVNRAIAVLYASLAGNGSRDQVRTASFLRTRRAARWTRSALRCDERPARGSSAGFYCSSGTINAVNETGRPPAQPKRAGVSGNAAFRSNQCHKDPEVVQRFSDFNRDGYQFEVARTCIKYHRGQEFANSRQVPAESLPPRCVTFA